MAHGYAVLERRRKPIFARRERPWRRDVSATAVAHGLIVLGAINAGAALLLYWS